MTTKRKSTARRKPNGTKARATTRYVVSADFKMRSNPMSKTAAEKMLAKVKRQGGTGTMRKV